VTKVQWHRRNEFGTPPRVKATKISDKFEVEGTVQKVNKGRSVRPCSSIHNESDVTVLQAYTQSPRKSVRQCNHETGKNPLNVAEKFNLLTPFPFAQITAN
jgi:hypothetical protein